MCVRACVCVHVLGRFFSVLIVFSLALGVDSLCSACVD